MTKQNIAESISKIARFGRNTVVEGTITGIHKIAKHKLIDINDLKERKSEESTKSRPFEDLDFDEYYAGVRIETPLGLLNTNAYFLRTSFNFSSNRYLISEIPNSGGRLFGTREELEKKVKKFLSAYRTGEKAKLIAVNYSYGRPTIPVMDCIAFGRNPSTGLNPFELDLNRDFSSYYKTSEVAPGFYVDPIKVNIPKSLSNN